MGGVDYSNWFDIFMHEIGVVFTKADQQIQKGIELWSELKTELSRNISEKQPTQNSTGQPNNGQSGEEHSSQEIPVAKVKEGPTQHWTMCLGEVEEEHVQHWAMCLTEVKEEPIQHWAMCLGEMKEEPGQNWAMSGSKIPESFIQEQKNDDCHDNKDAVEDEDEDYDDEEDKDETTVSKYCENMWEINLGAPGTCYYPPSNILIHNEENNGSSLRWRGGYEMLKNDDTSSKEDDSWDNEEEAKEWCRKYGFMSDENNESLVGHDVEDKDEVDEEDEDEDEDEVKEADDVSEKLQGFVDVKEEEIVNNMEFDEVIETIFPGSDWVYVTRD